MCVVLSFDPIFLPTGLRWTIHREGRQGWNPFIVSEFPFLTLFSINPSGVLSTMTSSRDKSHSLHTPFLCRTPLELGDIWCISVYSDDPGGLFVLGVRCQDPRGGVEEQQNLRRDGTRYLTRTHDLRTGNHGRIRHPPDRRSNRSESVSHLKIIKRYLVLLGVVRGSVRYPSLTIGLVFTRVTVQSSLNVPRSGDYSGCVVEFTRFLDKLEDRLIRGFKYIDGLGVRLTSGLRRCDLHIITNCCTKRYFVRPLSSQFTKGNF